ncbi:hypothetical protein Nepgr_029609 [Nepenthes gracilis]|uniref:Uncharacterized protein n=1 Tax=Nepenthes gracilis TaxID=150966 RepID=A0AAD3Y5P6_NEPGR|nr:hypothetical protein Nepgr_029609 [Nepenthes gracilis]
MLNRNAKVAEREKRMVSRECGCERGFRDTGKLGFREREDWLGEREALSRGSLAEASKIFPSALANDAVRFSPLGSNLVFLTPKPGIEPQDPPTPTESKKLQEEAQQIRHQNNNKSNNARKIWIGNLIRAILQQPASSLVNLSTFVPEGLT